MGQCALGIGIGLVEAFEKVGETVWSERAVDNAESCFKFHGH
jgi:hypothetical protein